MVPDRVFRRTNGRKLRGWRKLAGASWGPPKDPQFFGELEIDAAALVAFLQAERARTGAHVTLTHLVGKALAYGLACVPELNVRITRRRAYPRESVDIFFIVATENGEELTGVKVGDVDARPVADVAAELDARVRSLGSGVDEDFGRSKALMTRLPLPVLRIALRVAAWATSDRNFKLTRFGMQRQAFGSAMVTSVGMWGVGRAFSPLAPYYKVPLLVLVGAVTDRPVAVGGEVVVRPMLTVTATFDHRYADGSHASRLAAAVRDYCSRPEELDHGRQL
ncbi:2-oxo acid dehydrogenase subunit E2 [Hoyosella subflava]|uniref:Dihydrolipoyllysine-residue succinyltransferase component of 2-oxoglutarate dehydrogenase complex n=1 Tax=Hoyosella subflava (strain DSM 45089 / JCM 17490 / NBRC 109087 / DQS3-9A1) TaxID=443218 RepID=F6EPU0_HOYSD|nr:2-oxo acid dehydrogenase subunit E2 [Hoyosella subflava]AEF40569.1 2-oxo acid dehydrogenase acyltransferase catalytic domain protein [Hoyosella subflava DQS3-9A1]